jgi:uncharacterized protein YybS (DUF2232 family)
VDNDTAGRVAAALVVAALIPACNSLPLLTILFVPGIAAIIYLWSTRSFVLAVAALAANLAGITIWGGWYYGALVMIGFTLPALTLAIARQRGLSLPRSVALATIAPIIALAVVYPTWHQYLEIIAVDLKQIALEADLTDLYPDIQSRMLNYVEQVGRALVVLFPSLLLTYAGAVYSLGTLLGGYLTRRAGRFRAAGLSFAHWKAPEWTLILLGLAVIFVLTEVEVLAIIGWNVLLVMVIIYSICGLSLLEYLMRRGRMSAWTKTLIYLLIILTQVVMLFMPLAALFDSHFDFRRVRAKRIG